MKPIGYYPIIDALDVPPFYRLITITNATDDTLNWVDGKYYNRYHDEPNDPSRPHFVPVNRKDTSIFATSPPLTIAPGAKATFEIYREFSFPIRITYQSGIGKEKNVIDIILSDTDKKFKDDSDYTTLDDQNEVANNYVLNPIESCRSAFYTFTFYTPNKDTDLVDVLNITVRKHVWSNKLKFYVYEGGKITDRVFEYAKILPNGKIEVTPPINLAKVYELHLRVYDKHNIDYASIWDSPHEPSMLCHGWHPNTAFINLMTASDLGFTFHALGAEGVTSYKFISKLE